MSGQSNLDLVDFVLVHSYLTHLGMLCCTLYIVFNFDRKLPFSSEALTAAPRSGSRTMNDFRIFGSWYAKVYHIKGIPGTKTKVLCTVVRST